MLLAACRTEIAVGESFQVDGLDGDPFLFMCSDDGGFHFRTSLYPFARSQDLGRSSAEWP